MSHFLFGALGSKGGVPAGSLLLSVLTLKSHGSPLLGVRGEDTVLA